jgi:hypothetical protein
MYELKIDYNRDEGFSIFEEKCKISNEFYFSRSEEDIQINLRGVSPKINNKNLLLPLINGEIGFSDIYKCMSSFRVYAINSGIIRNKEINGGSSGGGYLEKEGGNIGAVYSQIESLGGVNSWLSYIVPGMKVFSAGTINGNKLLSFDESVKGFARNLFVEQVSDGTLSALGNLVALLQKNRPSVIVLEEPENNLHYGALFILLEAIQEAALSTQIIVTTHSPDLIDEKWMMPENIRIVEKISGETKVRMPSEEASIAIREHLMYPGQLLRANVLDPKVDSMVE